VHPITVPDYILVNYPGFGWIAVAPPSHGSTPPPATAQASKASGK
jgi:hypothetical protein